MARSDSWHEREDCRLCGSHSLTPVLTLPPTPPANELLLAGSPVADQRLFPLHLSVCGGCGHVQLPVVVDPARLFRNYVYVSGTSSVFVDHFRRYAASVTDKLRLDAGSFVVEIGSNDGTLLRFFKELGMAVAGVDPATDIAADATSRGIMTIPDFFTPSLADDIRRKWGTADLVVANNVFAHADDLHSMTEAVSTVMSADGTFVFEVSYLVDVLECCLFDTIYHEHLSYHHLGSLVPFFERHNLCLYDVERVNTHGGSIRCFVGRDRPATSALRRAMAYESAIGLTVPGSSKTGIETMSHMAKDLAFIRTQLRSALRTLKDSGYSVVGFGAPAKATTLTHCLDLSQEDVEFVVDDSPLKQGRLLPGKAIPILSPDALRIAATRGPVAVLILAWNFAESIMERHSYVTQLGGKFIIPVPAVRIVG